MFSRAVPTFSQLFGRLRSLQLRSNSDIREFYLGLNEAGSRKSYRDVKRYKRVSAGFLDRARAEYRREMEA